MQSHRPCWTGKREGDDFLGRIVAMDETWTRSYEPNLKRQSNEWKHPGSPRPKEVREGDINPGVWHWWGNTAPSCTSKADGKRYLLLHVPAVPSSPSAQEKTTTLGGTKLHHSSWQWKESRRCCCHGRIWYIHRTHPIWVHGITISSWKKNTAMDPVQNKR